MVVWGGGGLLLIPIDYTGTAVFRLIWSEKGFTFCLRGSRKGYGFRKKSVNHTRFSYLSSTFPSKSKR